MPKAMTPSEKFVGRRLPKEASYRDQLLSGFLKSQDEFCGKGEPNESWLRPAWKKLKMERLIRFGIAIGFGRATLKIYHLEPAGEVAAREAHARVTAARAARAQWATDFMAKRREMRPAADKSNPEAVPASQEITPSAPASSEDQAIDYDDLDI